MAYLTAYLDESYSDQGQRTFVLAGYADYSEKWVPFAAEWARILAEPPPINYFRSSEAANLEGQFERFSKAERDDKVAKLLSLICKHRPIAIISSLRGRDYEELLGKYPDALVSPDPYTFCIGNILCEVCDVAEEIKASQVSLIFDRNPQMEGETHTAYQTAREQVPRFRSCLADRITFADKKQQKPLQAADTIAYDVNKMFRLRIANPSVTLRKSLGIVASHCPIRGMEWTKDMLEQWFVRRNK